MKAKIWSYLRLAGISVLAATSIPTWAQQTPTPKPTAVPFLESCIQSELNADENLITNGDFTQGTLLEGEPPDTGWMLSNDTPVLRSEQIAADKVNYFLEFSSPGFLISAVPKANSTSTRFDLSFCAVIPAGGQIKILVGGVLVAGVPAITGSAYTGSFSLKSIVLNLSSNSSQSEKLIEFYYDGTSGVGPAYVDNILLEPSSAIGEDELTPSPTQEQPTPTPKPTGPSPTPTPSIKPGIPTPTATPAITADSVQMSANPPMLVVGPDDFAGTTGPRKQVALDLDVIGSNGKKIDILAIDKDASIKFLVDARGEAEGVGVVQGFESGGQDWQSIDNRQIDLSKFVGDYQGRAYFFPLKTFTGIVRVIVEIEYKGFANNQESTRKIRGVVPIVLQSDKESSMTNTTGSYNALQNMNLGKKAGDRGFRPDFRTNLYFRERIK